MTNPDSLGDLWHHGEDSSWQLLMAKIRHPELLIFITCKGQRGHHSHPNHPRSYSTTLPTLPALTSSGRQCYCALSHKSHANPNHPGSRGSHLLVPFSSPGLGSKNVTFLPSPGFFTGVLRKKNGSEHGQALGSVCTVSHDPHHTSSHGIYIDRADHERRAGSVLRTRRCCLE